MGLDRVGHSPCVPQVYFCYLYVTVLLHHGYLINPEILKRLKRRLVIVISP